MIVKGNNEGTDFAPIPAKMHPARCFQIIGLGTQPSNNPKFPDRDKVMIGWEIPGELIEIDGEKKPRIISQEYTVSIGQKANLRRDLESWRGKAFTAVDLDGWELSKVMGHTCYLNVVHKEGGGGKTYANIATISPLPAEITIPAAMLDTVEYDIADSEIPEGIPQWIKDKIAKSHEKSGSPVSAPPARPPAEGPSGADVDEDEPPF